MGAYPSTLPLPLLVDYQVDLSVGVSAVRFERGNSRQRRAAKRDRMSFSLTFLFTGAELWTWQSWANREGYDWHTMLLESQWSGLSSSSSAVILHTVRYTSDITIETVSADLYRVTVSAEMDVSTTPQGVVVATGNWYVARTPSNPATDFILGGTPAAPSADIIIASSPALPAA